MKLPYRVGDTFRLPLGDGALVEATIVAHDHHTVDIAVADFVLRVWDSALVLHRWKLEPARRGWRFGAQDARPTEGWPNRLGPAHAERIVAGIELPPLRVHNRWTPQFPPGYLRVAQRGMTLDPRELPPDLEVLDCSHVALTSLQFPPTLRALRLAWISVPVDLRELEALNLHTLHLEELRDVRGVDALGRLGSLRQLEMLGFWQLTLREVEPLLAHPHLVRAEIDIGGRRKNVELYKRANWAYPWPFEILAEGPAEPSMRGGVRRDVPLGRSG
jgi:hypothetical protein